MTSKEDFEVYKLAIEEKQRLLRKEIDKYNTTIFLMALNNIITPSLTILKEKLGLEKHVISIDSDNESFASMTFSIYNELKRKPNYTPSWKIHLSKNHIGMIRIKKEIFDRIVLHSTDEKEFEVIKVDFDFINEQINNLIEESKKVYLNLCELNTWQFENMFPNEGMSNLFIV